jgi:uncharacterized membrane protein
MFLFYFAIGLAIVATVFYHLIQKVTPANANPGLTLAVTYLTAALLSLGLLPFYPIKDGLAAGVRQLNWTSIGLGIVIVGLEIGFLLAYRAGWNVSAAAVVANVAVAVILMPLGLLLFKEKVTPVNVLGVILCIAGLVLVNRK